MSSSLAPIVRALDRGPSHGQSAVQRRSHDFDRVLGIADEIEWQLGDRFQARLTQTTRDFRQREMIAASEFQQRRQRESGQRAPIRDGRGFTDPRQRVLDRRRCSDQSDFARLIGAFADGWSSDQQHTAVRDAIACRRDAGLFTQHPDTDEVRIGQQRLGLGAGKRRTGRDDRLKRANAWRHDS